MKRILALVILFTMASLSLFSQRTNKSNYSVALEASTSETKVAYTAAVTAVSGYTVVASTNVRDKGLPETPTIKADGPTTFCNGGSVTLTSSEGYTYLWSTGATTQSITVTTSGSYTVQVTDAIGNQSAVSEKVEVTVNALPATPTITASGPTTFCADGSVNLTSSSGSTYLWSTGATSESINVTTSGSYTVQVTSSNGCQSAVSEATIVTVNALPATPTITADGPTTFCAGGSVILSSSAGSAYLWSNGSTTQSITIAISGSYTVRVTGVNGCQSLTSETTIVTVNTLPAKPTITPSGLTTFCAGGSVTLTSSAGSTYLWSNGATTPSIAVSTAGSYTVQVGSDKGCLSAPSERIEVTVNALPDKPSITAGGPTTFCDGGSVELTSSAGTNYLWSNSATSSAIAVTSSGSYTVQVTDANGCQSVASEATTVTVNSLPAKPNITPSGVTTFCAGGSVTLTSSAGSSYLWSTGVTSAIINVTTSGDYSVQVIDANGCQSVASEATTVTVNSLPATPTITADGATTFCAGGSVTLSSSAGENYLWANSATSSAIVVSTSGSFTVTVTDANGCQSAASEATIVTVNALPAKPNITPSGVTIFCAGGTVILTSSAGSAYSWSTGDTTSSIAVTTSGDYSVQVTDANGCLSPSSDTTIVTVNDLPTTPTITTDGPTTFCDGGSVTLTSSAEDNYLWSNGATSSAIAVSSSGSFTVMVTDINGCQSAASEATIVTVNALPATPTITADSPTTFCVGGSVTLTSSAEDSYLWSNGATTRSIEVSELGDYSVTVFTINGCGSMVSEIVQVELIPLPLVDITSSNSTICLNDTRVLTGTPTEGVFLVKDGPGLISDNVLTAIGVGVILVEYTYTDVCTNTASQSIDISDNPYAFAGPDQELDFVYETRMQSELGLNETGEWSLISGTGEIEDIHSPTTLITGLSNGENSFLWSVRNEYCNAEAIVNIIVHDLNIPSVITPNGDGKNDYFVINALVGQVELVVFNRWGNVEYQNKNYLNDWNGQKTTGGQVPDGTYLYVIRFDNGLIRKGTVLILR